MNKQLGTMNTMLQRKPFSTLLLGVLFGLLFLVSSTDSYAVNYAGRLNRYSYFSFTSTFVSIAPVNGGSGTFVINGDDSRGSVPMPFDFNLDSSKFLSGSTLYVYDNGYAAFVANSSSQYSPNLGSTSYPSQFYVWQSDQYVNTGIYYQTTGAVGSRVLTIEWTDLRGYSGNNKVTNMQLKLYEGTQVFEYLYKDYNYEELNYQKCTTGISGSNVSPFYAYSFYTSTTLTPGTNFRGVCPALPDQNLTSSPKTLDYLAQFTGVVVQKTVTIQNVGVANNLIFNSASIVGNPDYTVFSAPAPGTSLAPGQTASIVVQFVAQQNGPRTGILSIVTNGLDSGIQTINLKGSGIAPVIQVDTNILFRKKLVPMGTTVTQWVHITALGQAALFFSTFPITGPDSDQYKVTYFPANPMAAGTTDSLAVAFTPIREGRKSAMLTINSNASNTPAFQINLAGTGILPHILVTPTTLLFDSTGKGDTVCKNITIYNGGSDTLRILANQLASNDGDFTYAGLTGSDTAIPPDKLKTVTVCFIPKQAGTRVARLVLKTNIIPTFEQVRRDTAGTIMVDIRGTGVPFGILAQTASSITDSAVVGASICRNDTLWNKGDADIQITSATISSTHAADFVLSGIKTPFTIKAGGYVVATICTTPSQRGLNNATILFSGKSNNHPVAASSAVTIKGLLLCASSTPAGLFNQLTVYKGSDSTECVTVTNCGDIAATYTATIGGANAADYTVTPANSALIAAGGTAKFCVKYLPTAVGASPATLAITAQDIAPMNVPLGASAGCALLTADAPVIPHTNAGGHSTFTVHITNTGTYRWNLGTPLVTSATPGIFTYVSATNASVPETNGATDLTFKYDPTEVSKTYSATVTFPQSGPCEASALQITLSQSTGTEGVRSNVTAQDGFSIGQNHPNPFVSATTFSYNSPRETTIKLSLRDITGKFVQTVVEGRVSSGEHIVTLDAQNLPSGSYLLILEADNVQLSRQIVITK